MARKERNDIDYFPHSVSHGKKMFYLRATYGNDGYAVWFMLLEHLGKASYHYLDLSDDIELMYLSSEFKVSEIVLKEIINSLVKFGEFDAELWNENSILFNEKFVENISDAYKKRNNDCINKKSLLLLLEAKGIRKPLKSNPKHLKENLKDYDNTQSKVKYSKEEEIKEKEVVYSFEDFWNIYPNKVAKAKCKEKFLKLSDNDKLKIKETINDFIKYKPFKDYNHPNPETYLNQKRWEDEIKTATGTKQFSNPDNERIVKFNTNVNFTTRRLPESKFLAEQEAFRGGGYIYKILGYE